MLIFLGLVIGLFLTMVLIPPLVRVSDRLQLLDLPGRRKVHAAPVPRVGGIAVFFGSILPILIWAQLDWSSRCYLIAAGLIVLFGAIDDRKALGYKWKFAGQAIAALILVGGGVHFERLPFLGLEPVSPWISYPISFLFILGVTNALNLADGLDGLAAGNALISLAMVAGLGYLAGGTELSLIAAGLIGAVLGFLRFNTHPAVVFLGDAGSQYLGFSLAALAILLTTDVSTALSSALPVFLVGLPLLDTISVFIIRLRNGDSPFKADKRHFHHRLLSLGYKHHEAVAIIYFLQALYLLLGFVLRYQSDILILALFALVSAAIYGALFAAEATRWRMRPLTELPPDTQPAPTPSERRNLALRRFAHLPSRVAHLVQWGASGFLLACALLVRHPPVDIATVSLGTAGMMVFAHYFLNAWTRLFTRVGVYVAGLFIVFLLVPTTEASDRLDWAVNSYLFVLCCGLALAIRLTRRETFRMTPQDLLMLLFVFSVPSLSLEPLAGYPVNSMVLRAAVVFYSCEYVLSRDQVSFLSLRIAGFLTLAILGFRGTVF